ncbi:MAG: hypothetical protein M3Y22_06885, partial [Pseudomonadota bacterium]|nr:hypothetical protein [Pseudomonadota bacterium]
MIDRRSRSATAFWPALALILAFAGACLWFATRQDIWIDESTQLSGITLSPVEMVRWLAGTDTQRFGLPGDRMPPLGYLLDWAWWHAVSQSVLGLRLFHAAFVVAALALFARTERNYGGGRWGGGRWPIVGLIFLAVSPKTIQFAVELRSYPMLFAMACVQAALFLRLVAVPGLPSWRALAGFALVCVATSFVHFFGVVATCAYFGALLLRFLRIAPGRIIIAGIGALIPLLALKPFVTGASAVSGEAIAVGVSPVQYILQLLAGSAYLVLPFAGLLFLGGCAALIGIAIVCAAARASARRTEPVDYMIVVAVLGVLATILPHFVIHSFDTLKPSYSIWLLPVLALIVASGARQVTGRGFWPKRGVQAAVAALVLGATLSTAIFLAHADWYTHGPARQIARINPATPRVYADAGTYGYGYFPSVYLSHGRAAQWLAEGRGVRRLPDSNDQGVEPLTILSRNREVVIVDIRLRRYSDLGQCLRGACPPFERAPVLDAMLASGTWREGSSTRTFGYYDTTITHLY